MKRWLGFGLLLALLLALALPAGAEELAVAQASAAGEDEIVGEAEELSAEALFNAATKLSVSKSKSVTLYAGTTYQLKIPGKTIKSCKSADSKIVKATKAGLLTVKKKGNTKITVTPKGGKAFVLTVKVKVKAVELSGYVGKNAKKSAKKLGLTKKKNGAAGSLKYTRYYKGGVSLYNIRGPWDKGQVDLVHVEDTSKYSLIGVTVGMKLSDVRKKLKKYEDINYFQDYGDQLYYVITWEGDQDYPINDLSVSYRNGKVISISYGYYID